MRRHQLWPKAVGRHQPEAARAQQQHVEVVRVEAATERDVGAAGHVAPAVREVAAQQRVVVRTT